MEPHLARTVIRDHGKVGADAVPIITPRAGRRLVRARCDPRRKDGAMPRESKAQKDTVGRVMHEFKEGDLKSSSGKKVTNPKQAIAIGLSEAGASNQQSPAQNRDRKSTRLNSSHVSESRMPSSA